MAFDWSTLHPVFAQRLQAMFAAAAAEGRTLGIGSGRRSIEEQIKLRIKNGCPDIWSSPAKECRVPTAIPGRSKHNHGLAADLTGDKKWANANARRFGLQFNVQGEDWHVEPVGDFEAQEASKFAGAPMDFDFEWMTEKRNPQDELASRLFSIQGMLNSGSATAGTPDEMIQPATPQSVDPATQQSSIDEFGADETMIFNQDKWRRRLAFGMDGGEASPDGDWTGAGLPPPGYVPPGKGVERWRQLAIQALQYTGEDPRLVDLMLRRMNQESGGNPFAKNMWDSNAKRGDPSIGLMQNIGSAFAGRAQELAGRGATDGFASMVASIRYTKNRYGNLAAGWGRRGGY